MLQSHANCGSIAHEHAPAACEYHMPSESTDETSRLASRAAACVESVCERIAENLFCCRTRASLNISCYYGHVSIICAYSRRQRPQRWQARIVCDSISPLSPRTSSTVSSRRQQKLPRLAFHTTPYKLSPNAVLDISSCPGWKPTS